MTFHYDTLEALDRHDAYARVSSVGFASAAVSSVLGGVLGLVDLRLTFAASLVLAVRQLEVTLALHEPPATGPSPVR
ncbi:MAG: hypothetical protein OEV40_18070 [Acidimicrobiia bacterium]|nr:hypothetical protein [Acidimicrobiia bacterium]